MFSEQLAHYWALVATLLVAAFCVTCARGETGRGDRWALSQWQRQVWQVEDGLPHNYVTAVARPDNRYLLVGTQAGIARFDGLRFTPLEHLQEKWIYSLKQTSDGVLWVGTYRNGLYSIEHGRLHSVQGPNSESVFSLLESRSHRLWLVTDAGLSYVSDQRVHSVSRGTNTNGYAWQSLTEDASGALWFASSEGLQQYQDTHIRSMQLRNVQGRPVTVYSGPLDKVLYLGTTSGLYTLRCDATACDGTAIQGITGAIVGLRAISDGSLWVATWGQGIYRVTGARREALSEREGLADNFVRTIEEDADQNVWVGTRGGGITRFRTSVLKPVGGSEGLGGNCASVATSDGDGGMWLGTWRSGLFHWRNGRVELQPLPVTPLSLLVSSLATDKNRNLWIGTDHALWFLARDASHAVKVPLSGEDHFINHLLLTRDGALWVAREDAGLSVFPSGNPTTSSAVNLFQAHDVRALLEDKSGVWVGTAKGLWRVVMRNGLQITQVTGITKTVTALIRDLQGRIWAAADDGSIYVLVNGNATELHHNPLPAPAIFSILAGAKDDIWFSTARGLARAKLPDVDRSLATPSSVVPLARFGIAQGMRTVECRCAHQPQGGTASNGTVWFPTAKGYVQIDPADDVSLPPPVAQIEDVTVDGRAAKVVPHVTIPPGSHDLQVRFTVFRPGSASGIRFRYRLDPLETRWTDGGSSRIAHYARVPPGQFQLLIAASDYTGIWSKAVPLPLEQLPLFHQTWWFRTVLILLALAMIGIAYHFRLRVIRTRFRAVLDERSRIAREWHDTLLAGISAVGWQLDTAISQCRDQPLTRSLVNARGMLRYCSNEARRAVSELRSQPELEITFEQSIRTAVEQTAAGSSARVLVNVDPNLSQCTGKAASAALRICQEATANAVRHANASQISVQVARQQGELSITVEDDGVGLDASSLDTPRAGHFGMLGMKERAEELSGQLHVASEAGKGTVVRAVIPLSS